MRTHGMKWLSGALPSHGKMKLPSSVAQPFHSMCSHMLGRTAVGGLSENPSPPPTKKEADMPADSPANMWRCKLKGQGAQHGEEVSTQRQHSTSTSSAAASAQRQLSVSPLLARIPLFSVLLSVSSLFYRSLRSLLSLCLLSYHL